MKNNNQEVEQICAYCEESVLIAESDMCICRKEGAVKAGGTCRKFKADLLKLAPIPRKLPDEDTVFFDI